MASLHNLSSGLENTAAANCALLGFVPSASFALLSSSAQDREEGEEDKRRKKLLVEEEEEEEGEDGAGRWSLKKIAIILIGLEVLEFL